MYVRNKCNVVVAYNVVGVAAADVHFDVVGLVLVITILVQESGSSGKLEFVADTSKSGKEIDYYYY